MNSTSKKDEQKKLTDNLSYGELIYQGLVCPYCGNPSEFLDSKIVYGKSYGMIYICRKDDAYVGIHKDSERAALGRLANKELRYWKQLTHATFDRLWSKKMEQGASKTQARNAAYDWLSIVMKKPREITHIGMFDVEDCKLAINLCAPYVGRPTKKK